MSPLKPGAAPPRARLLTSCSRAVLALVLLSLLVVATPGAPTLARGEDAPLAVAATGELPAFPGAQGYGALTPGGRGGTVLFVTNLNDAGPGSLRAALEASGRRIVIFRVGGVIRLSTSISITHPYVTLAGQTAPGDGIVLRGGGLKIRTHDVIVRGMRFRVGDDSAGEPAITREGIMIAGPDRSGNPPRRIIIDHCSISWSIDENASVVGAEEVTIQWSLLSEGLNNSLHDKPGHSNALLIAENSRRVSVHHNLLAHHWYRSPLVKGGTEAEILANVVYNWGSGATVFEDGSGAGPTRAVVAGNVYRRGPSTQNDTALRIYKSVAAGSAIFVSENIGAARVMADAPVLAGAAPLAAPAVPVRAVAPAAVLDAVLFGAGARLPASDPIDRRVVAEVRAGTGRIIDTVAEVGGWEVLARWDAGAAPADGDGDGMPDAWERERGLNPADPADGARQAPSGYTWVEEYINGIAPRGLSAQVYLPLAGR